MTFSCNNTLVPKEMDVMVVSRLNDFEDWKSCTLVSKSLGIAVETFANQKLNSWHCIVTPLGTKSFKRLLNLEHLMNQWQSYCEEFPIPELKVFDDLKDFYGCNVIFHVLDSLESESPLFRKIKTHTEHSFPKHTALIDFKRAIIRDDILEAIRQSDRERFLKLTTHMNNDIYKRAVSVSVQSYNFEFFSELFALKSKFLITDTEISDVFGETTIKVEKAFINISISRNVNFVSKACIKNKTRILTLLKNDDYDFDKIANHPLMLVTSKDAASILIDAKMDRHRNTPYHGFLIEYHIRKTNFELAKYLIQSSVNLSDMSSFFLLNLALKIEDKTARDEILEVLLPRVTARDIIHSEMGVVSKVKALSKSFFGTLLILPYVCFVALKIVLVILVSSVILSLALKIIESLLIQLIMTQKLRQLSAK